MAKAPLKFSVGLEIHARLNTDHKIFCRCDNKFGSQPNTNICPVCLGLPGSLPVLNPEVIVPALRAATALNCDIAGVSEFSRKNYFYPDLPRNYQITQFDKPFAFGGYLSEAGVKVRLIRIHLEEDAGRSLISAGGLTRVDLNRAGSPLIEIVTEPDLENGQQARQWLGRLRQILQYLDVCDGEMENGSLRCDANVGLTGDHPQAGPWVELKNLNSFKWVGQAVDFEIERLRHFLHRGQSLRRETRSWDPRQGKTNLLRSKESHSDYRFFPEPDLLPLVLDSREINDISDTLPELPEDREERFVADLGVKKSDAVILCRTLELADFFETCTVCFAEHSGLQQVDCGTLVGKWVLSVVLGGVGGKDKSLSTSSLTPEILARILGKHHKGTISRTLTVNLIGQVMGSEQLPDIAEMIRSCEVSYEKNSCLLDDYCNQVILENPQKTDSYRKGKTGLLNFFIGQVISLSGGCLDAEKIRVKLKKKLI